MVTQETQETPKNKQQTKYEQRTSTSGSTRSTKNQGMNTQVQKQHERGTSIHLNQSSKEHIECNISVNRSNIAMYRNNITITKQPN